MSHVTFDLKFIVTIEDLQHWALFLLEASVQYHNISHPSLFSMYAGVSMFSLVS